MPATAGHKEVRAFEVGEPAYDMVLLLWSFRGGDLLNGKQKRKGQSGVSPAI